MAKITDLNVKLPRVKNVYSVCIGFCEEIDSTYTTLAEVKARVNELAKWYNFNACIHKGKWFVEYNRYDDVNLDDCNAIVEVYTNRC